MTEAEYNNKLDILYNEYNNDNITEETFLEIAKELKEQYSPYLERNAAEIQKSNEQYQQELAASRKAAVEDRFKIGKPNARGERMSFMGPGAMLTSLMWPGSVTEIVKTGDDPSTKAMVTDAAINLTNIAGGVGLPYLARARQAATAAKATRLPSIAGGVSNLAVQGGGQAAMNVLSDEARAAILDQEAPDKLQSALLGAAIGAGAAIPDAVQMGSRINRLPGIAPDYISSPKALTPEVLMDKASRNVKKYTGPDVVVSTPGESLDQDIKKVLSAKYDDMTAKEFKDARNAAKDFSEYTKYATTLEKANPKNMITINRYINERKKATSEGARKFWDAMLDNALVNESNMREFTDLIHRSEFPRYNDWAESTLNRVRKENLEKANMRELYDEYIPDTEADISLDTYKKRKKVHETNSKVLNDSQLKKQPILDAGKAINLAKSELEQLKKKTLPTTWPGKVLNVASGFGPSTSVILPRALPAAEWQYPDIFKWEHSGSLPGGPIGMPELNVEERKKKENK